MIDKNRSDSHVKKIPKNMSPDLIKVLMEMGHGDEIVIAEGNFPSAANAKRLVRCDGLSASAVLKSILELFPIDTYTKSPISLMAVVENDAISPFIWEEYSKILNHSDAENKEVEYLERFAFYERSKKAYAIVATGEEALYANSILRKGVVKNN